MPDEIVAYHLHVPIDAELHVSICRVERVAIGRRLPRLKLQHVSGLIWLNCFVMMSTVPLSTHSNCLIATPITIRFGISSFSATFWCATAGRTASAAPATIAVDTMEGLMLRSIVFVAARGARRPMDEAGGSGSLSWRWPE
jgi:hypothetical protein